MATQTGITVAAPNEPYVVVDAITRPKPGPKQVLLKSIATGINPVESFMQHSGMLVVEWPAILGCDASGVVIECGSEVTKFKPGDHAYGCTRVGQNQYSTFQETFLMDEDVAFKRSDSISTLAACTIGVGLDTAALSLLAGTDMSLPPPGEKAAEKDEWIIVIGASGSVGQYGVQIGHLCGYKVLATCSPSKASILLSQGATATLNNRGSLDEQLAEIKKVTGGKFARVFDASTYGYELAIKALETCSSMSEKWFATVDDWSEMHTPSSIHEYRTLLGTLGRPEDPKGAKTTANLASWVPTLEGHLDKGTLAPLEYEVVEGKGWNAVIKAVAQLEAGNLTKKLVVRIQDE